MLPDSVLWLQESQQENGVIQVIIPTESGWSSIQNFETRIKSVMVSVFPATSFID